MKHIIAFLLLASACLAQPARSFGLKFSKHGIRATPIAQHPRFKIAPLPATASDAENYFFTDQKDRGACVAFSTWETTAAAYAKKNKGKRLNLSALDIYQQCLVADGNFPNDEGTYGATAIKVLLTSGAMTEKTWPYSIPLSRLPDNSPKCSAKRNTERQQNMALKAYALPVNDQGYAIKQCIANLKSAPMIGRLWYGNQYNSTEVKCQTKDANGNTITVTRHIIAMPKGAPIGGHEVPYIEYDDNLVLPDGRKGAIRFKNHWEGFGDKISSAWMSYDQAFNPRYADDAVVITEIK